MDIGVEHVLVECFGPIVLISERKLKVEWQLERDLLRMKEDVKSIKRENSFP